MISTVTTSTITTITSMIDVGTILGLVAVFALIAFLCIKELAGAASEGSTPRFLASSFDIAIVPLVIAFVMIVAMKVVEILA